jgi:hypothetical protein
MLNFLYKLAKPTLENLEQNLYMAGLFKGVAHVGSLFKNTLCGKNKKSAPRVLPQNLYQAIAGGYRNNCGVNSIAHCWLSLPQEQIRALYATHPIFEEIITTFYEYHQIPREPNLDEFLFFVTAFNHPKDRELMMGQVLRNVILRYAPNGDHFNIENNNFIADDTLALLTREMGAKFTSYNLSINQDEFGKATDYLPIGGEIPSWNVELFFVNNNHFNFRFPDEQTSILHNEKREALHNSLLIDAIQDEYHYDEDSEEYEEIEINYEKHEDSISFMVREAFTQFIEGYRQDIAEPIRYEMRY